jgi:hypothetical protein
MEGLIKCSSFIFYCWKGIKLLTNILKTLVNIVSICVLHVIFLPKIIEIFYVIYRTDLPSFQCKMTLDWSTSMREIDGLSLNLHWFLGSSAQTMTRMKWGRDAVSWWYNLQCDLLHIDTCHQRRGLRWILRIFGGIIYVHKLQGRVQDGTL